MATLLLTPPYPSAPPEPPRPVGLAASTNVMPSAGEPTTPPAPVNWNWNVVLKVALVPRVTGEVLYAAPAWPKRGGVIRSWLPLRPVEPTSVKPAVLLKSG